MKKTSRHCCKGGAETFRDPAGSVRGENLPGESDSGEHRGQRGPAAVRNVPHAMRDQRDGSQQVTIPLSLWRDPHVISL